MRDKLRKMGGGGSVDLTWKGPVATLTLNNEASRNAVSGEMMAQLGDAVDALEESAGIGLILRGAGDKAFCAGAHLDFVEGVRGNAAMAALMCATMQDTTHRLRNLQLVSVSAIEGGAWGGGAELITATDFRVMSRGGVVRFVHAARGLAPGWGGGVRLPSVVGRQNALRLLCTAAEVRDQEALRMGLVDQLCEPGGALEAAETLLAPMSELRPESIRACKSMVSATEAVAYVEALTAFTSAW